MILFSITICSIITDSSRWKTLNVITNTTTPVITISNNPKKLRPQVCYYDTTNSIIYLIWQICQTSRVAKLNFKKFRLFLVPCYITFIVSFSKFHHWFSLIIIMTWVSEFPPWVMRLESQTCKGGTWLLINLLQSYHQFLTSSLFVLIGLGHSDQEVGKNLSINQIFVLVDGQRRDSWQIMVFWQNKYLHHL